MKKLHKPIKPTAPYRSPWRAVAPKGAFVFFGYRRRARPRFFVRALRALPRQPGRGCGLKPTTSARLPLGGFSPWWASRARLWSALVYFGEGGDSGHRKERRNSLPTVASLRLSFQCPPRLSPLRSDSLGKTRALRALVVAPYGRS